jgi:hypothetical protein
MHWLYMHEIEGRSGEIVKVVPLREAREAAEKVFIYFIMEMMLVHALSLFLSNLQFLVSLNTRIFSNSRLSTLKRLSFLIIL